MDAFCRDLLLKMNQKIIGCESQLRTVKESLESFVDRKEGGSMLLIGPRGSGKTTVLNKVLEDVGKSAVVIKLNGFIQTTDKQAIGQFAKQINRNADLQDLDLPTVSVSDYFQQLLKSTGKSEDRRCYLFVVDEFDLFAQRTNQILLYLLLDATRLIDVAPVFVVGLTTRHDASELLEKRVRSRLDNRQVFFDERLSFAMYLSVSKDLITVEDKKRKHVQQWNSNVEELFNNDQVVDRLTTIHSQDHSISTLKCLLVAVVCRAHDTHPFITPEILLKSAESVVPVEDPKAIIIRGLSVLELCLLVCIRKHQRQKKADTFNFETISQHFERFARAHHRTLACHPKEVLFKSLERLSELRLVAPASTATRLQQMAFRPMTLQVDAEVLDTVSKQYQPLPTAIEHWISHEKLIY